MQSIIIENALMKVLLLMVHGKKRRYNDQLRYGYLSLLKTTHDLLGFVPRYIQRTVLYELTWYFKYLLNSEEKIAFLDQKDITVFKQLLCDIFNYIEIKTINAFNLAGIQYYHKIAWLHTYKNQVSQHQVIYIDKYNIDKHELQLRYFYTSPILDECVINNKSITPYISKIRDYKFMGEVFVYEKIIWIPLSDEELTLKAKINGQDAIWSIEGEEHSQSVVIKDIIQHLKETSHLIENIPLKHYIYKRFLTSRYFSSMFNQAWLLMDRDIQADDNAEHLYRYLSKQHPEINLYFLLRKESHDWVRLKNDGFNLIEFGSHKHKAALVNASHNISSHADKYVTNYLPNKWYKDIIKSKYTFLQHGIIQNDLSKWLNNKQIDCFITTTRKEYDSISANHNAYKFTQKEVSLTGLPRHDRLLYNIEKKEKIILIMPTWRKSLTGTVIGKSNDREMNPNFQTTHYFKAWSSLLHNQDLQKLSQQHKYRIIFFCHVNIHPYLDQFNIPNYIETYFHQKGSIQKLFQRSALMITDYSSVAFEMGMLRRAVLYYQFDYNEIFSGIHITQKGYFDYEKDGFGPVCYDENSVINEIKFFLDNDGLPRKEYLQRMKEFFVFHDTDNCHRVYHAIKGLES